MANRHGLKHVTCQRACNSTTFNLRPERLRLVVIHQQITVIEQPGNPESKLPVVDNRIEGHSSAAQRAERNQHGLTAGFVVNDLMPVKNADWKRVMALALIVGHHQVALFPGQRGGCRLKLWLVY
jgi:hypothetical protein